MKTLFVRVCVLCVAGLLLATGPVLAQGPPRPTTPLPPEAAKSMGQPPLFKPYLAGQFTWNRETDQSGGAGIAGIYKDLVLPVSGALGVSAEGYVGGSGSEWDGGGRLFLTSRLLFLNLGVDYNAQMESADFIVGFNPYFRRGGLFGHGGNLRIEWIPTRGHSFNVGFQIPLEPHMGETRPRRTHVELPKGPKVSSSTLPSESFDALEDMRHAGRWLIVNANLFTDEDNATYEGAMEDFRRRFQEVRNRFIATDEDHPEGHTFVRESRHYHEAIDRAFAAAVGEDRGRAVADQAREILLDDVLLPYDRLFGQFKDPDTLLGLGGQARLRLGQALDARGGFSADQHAAALGTFDRLVDLIETGRRLILEHWDEDTRMVWLPLTLAVRDEDHDSEEELAALIERALGRRFDRGNTVLPTMASRFAIELVRSIRAAQDYHVLWIHDYAGRVNGEPDSIAHRVSIEYLETLAEHVRRYDETGRMPTFMIFHTQFFYEGSGSRLFLSLLEDPMHHELKLGKGYEDMEKAVRKAQEELRQAVAGSERLQAEAERNGGDGWIRDVVKVHVSVTFPADLSFRTPKIVQFLPFAPDSLMLDHRKLFFYDVSEQDPRRGEACFTGTGVGSEYAGPTWDDRGILTSGPALLGLRDAARRLLLSQGFDEEEIPRGLRPKPRPGNYDELVQELEDSGRSALGMNVHNEVGFGAKENTVAQAILYTMAPKDTVIVVPDSIWTSPVWAGQLVGAALRGCHVYAVAPSQDNAPAAGLPVLAGAREIFGRMLEASQVLGEEIAAEGGHLRVGLYTRAAPSDSAVSALREMSQRLKDHPWLPEEFPMPPNLARLLGEQADELEAQGYEPRHIAKGTREGRPKMHRKTQLFATRKALRAVADMPALVDGLRRYIDEAATGSADPASLLEQGSPLGPAGPVLRSLIDDPPPEAKDALYFLTVGSKNQDDRGAMLDGENSYVVVGPWSLVYYPDFMGLMANTTWIERQEQLDELISVEEAKARKLGRMIRKVL
ncbi:MAG: hypothetical protein LJF30_21040 [Acidobacteria bacterium]|nr:hypothetical protein [Acidobacteriota bacterium]